MMMRRLKKRNRLRYLLGESIGVRPRDVWTSTMMMPTEMMMMILCDNKSYVSVTYQIE